MNRTTTKIFFVSVSALATYLSWLTTVAHS
jgi:hypothetical protein